MRPSLLNIKPIYWLRTDCIALSFSLCLLAFLAGSAEALAVSGPQEAVGTKGTEISYEEKIADVNARLAAACTPADSLAPLYNLYDLSYGRDSGNAVGWVLLETAIRAGDETVALDVLRNMANYNMRNDSILSLVLEQAKKFPASNDRTHTITFIRIIQNNSRALYAAPEVREKQLQNFLQQLSLNPPTDLYERIVLLYAVCINLSEFANGDLLTDYLQRLGELIEEADPENHALRNVFNVWAGMIYTKVEKPSLAIDASLKLLGEIDMLDERNAQMGRIYRNYDANRYIVYTRILQNYEALSEADIEKYHRLALEMVARNSRAAKTYHNAPVPSIFYYYSKKDYTRTFNLIDNHLDAINQSFGKRKLLKMYMESARAIGRQDALLNASALYCRELEEDLENRQQERYRELQVLYDVNDMKIRNLRLKEEKQGAQKAMWRTVTIVCALLLLALFIFTLILIRLNRRRALLARKLEKSNNDLAHQRDNLRKANEELKEARDVASRANQMKTDFINNMSHEVRTPLQAMTEYAAIIADNAEDTHRQYMRDFADRLLLNCQMVNTIVDDVLQLAELNNSSLIIKQNLFSSKPICDTAADAVRRRLQPGVELRVEADDFIFRTDRHRLLQILNNLLTNAVKFTSRGTITLACTKNETARTVEFSVTDTGIGISPSDSEIIFERFHKLDSSAPGAGIGLTIARMIARLMGGDLILDKAYAGHGARFLLTLPYDV